jgi:hypothetical protein
MSPTHQNLPNPFSYKVIRLVVLSVLQSKFQTNKRILLPGPPNGLLLEMPITFYQLFYQVDFAYILQIHQERHYILVQAIALWSRRRNQMSC